MTDAAIRPFHIAELVRSIYLPEVKLMAIVYPAAIVVAAGLFLVHATTGIEFVSRTIPVVAQVPRKTEAPPEPIVPEPTFLENPRMTQAPPEPVIPEPVFDPIPSQTPKISDLVAGLNKEAIGYASVGYSVGMSIPVLDDRLPWMKVAINGASNLSPSPFGSSPFDPYIGDHNSAGFNSSSLFISDLLIRGLGGSVRIGPGMTIAIEEVLLGGLMASQRPSDNAYGHLVGLNSEVNEGAWMGYAHLPRSSVAVRTGVFRPDSVVTYTYELPKFSSIGRDFSWGCAAGSSCTLLPPVVAAPSTLDQGLSISQESRRELSEKSSAAALRAIGNPLISRGAGSVVVRGAVAAKSGTPHISKQTRHATAVTRKPAISP
jgi:hypothetical protein